MKFTEYLVTSSATSPDASIALSRILSGSYQQAVSHQNPKDAGLKPFGSIKITRNYWLGLVHACFGIGSEIAELFLPEDDINVCEELGDFTWYAADGVRAILAAVTPAQRKGFQRYLEDPTGAFNPDLFLPWPDDVDLEAPMTLTNGAMQIAVLSSWLQDAGKRALFYGQEKIKIGGDKMKEYPADVAIMMLLLAVLTWCIRYLKAFNEEKGATFSLSDVFLANNAKLAARAKNAGSDGFSELAWTERDLVGERKVLEESLQGGVVRGVDWGVPGGDRARFGIGGGAVGGGAPDLMLRRLFPDDFLGGGSPGRESPEDSTGNFLAVTRSGKVVYQGTSGKALIEAIKERLPAPEPGAFGTRPIISWERKRDNWTFVLHAQEGDESLPDVAVAP